jgi:hypothetical protein
MFLEHGVGTEGGSSADSGDANHKTFTITAPPVGKYYGVVIIRAAEKGCYVKTRDRDGVWIGNNVPFRLSVHA